MFAKHKVDKLEYVHNLVRKSDSIAYFDDKRGLYIDITSNSVASSHNERTYQRKNIKKICDFKTLIYHYDLWLLLIDANGNLKDSIILPQTLEILMLFKSISTLNKDFEKEVNKIINKVVKICAKNLKLSQNKEFNGLLKSYIFLELMINGEGERSLIINKTGNLLDYKIMRILKYLKIDKNINDIQDFRIEYDLEKIKYYDVNKNLTEIKCLSKEEKVKILI